jgi:hypothetical protein
LVRFWVVPLTGPVHAKVKGPFEPVMAREILPLSPLQEVTLITVGVAVNPAGSFRIIPETDWLQPDKTSVTSTE